MSKKSDVNNVIEQNIVETLETNYMPYTMSVIISRAIPEIDGFKPAHRKLLYTMYKMGLLTGGRIKSNDVVGQTMRLNPHGDSAIYETMVRLTRGNDALLHPFVDSKGNFGKQYSRDMAYAASRYTEVKLDKICEEIFADIEKDTVEMVENYNGTTTEPLLFPTTFPNLLVTPNQGIAVGMASCVCSFNLKEVCAATIAYIKNPDCDLLKLLPAPDFSTGGELIYNQKEMETLYTTGRGGFKVRARYRFDKKNSCLEIFEIPYTTTSEAIIDKIIALVKANKLREVNDVRDETDINGLKIAIDIKRGVDHELLMHKLYDMTPLRDTFSGNFNILIEGRPRVMGIKEILEEWVSFRVKCVKRGMAFDIRKKSERLHLLSGLAEIVLDIDRAIKIIRETKEEKLVIGNLMKGFKIDEIQAEFIAEIKLRNLNEEYLFNKIKERDSLEKEIAGLKEILADDKKVKERISEQLKEISKKHGKPRRTGIVSEEEVPEIPKDVFIDDYSLKLFLTEHNYLKKISLVSLRSASEQYLKDDDKIIQELETTNRCDALFFSDKQNVYKAKIHELPDCKASSLGEYMTNLLGLEENERIVFVAVTLDYKGHIFFGFENGKAAKIEMECYATKVNRKKLVNAYSDKSPLIFAEHIMTDKDYIAVRDSDKATLFNTGLISPKVTKNSSGVQVYNLKKNSRLSKIMQAPDFVSDEIEYYRTDKIPSTGHFIIEKDKQENNLERQMKLISP